MRQQVNTGIVQDPAPRSAEQGKFRLWQTRFVQTSVILNEPQCLYHPANEHDACGVGFVAHIKGKKSHSIVEQGLTVLRNLTHRGAVGWDPKLSDGAGLLIQIPDKFLREVMAKQGLKLPPAGQYGVGVVFLPRDPASRFACEYEIERAIKDEGQILLGWRDVPWTTATLRNRRSGSSR